MPARLKSRRSFAEREMEIAVSVFNKAHSSPRQGLCHGQSGVYSLQPEEYDSKSAPLQSRTAAGIFEPDFPPAFNTLIFEEIRKYARDFFKSTVVGRTVFHKKLPFAFFCSMDFDVCS